LYNSVTSDDDKDYFINIVMDTDYRINTSTNIVHHLVEICGKQNKNKVPGLDGTAREVFMMVGFGSMRICAYYCTQS
jgi:hypothetical protein